MSNSWYSKKIVVLFVFLSISLIFVFSGKNVKLGNTQNSKYAVFSIRFEYFGMDAENIERINNDVNSFFIFLSSYAKLAPSATLES